MSRVDINSALVDEPAKVCRQGKVAKFGGMFVGVVFWGGGLCGGGWGGCPVRSRVETNSA
jgi:hypothetical protein